MKRYFKYLLVSYITAVIFEFIANTIGDGKLFLNPIWPILFLIWYGFIYSLLYFIFRNKSLWAGVIFFAIFGVIAEIIIFHRSNLVVDFIIYALMGFVPLWTNKKFSKSQF
jgi:hypothetical protein